LNSFAFSWNSMFSKFVSICPYLIERYLNNTVEWLVLVGSNGGR
jgi:hypothetical protein